MRFSLAPFSPFVIRLRPLSQTSDQHAQRSSIPSTGDVSHFASAHRRISPENRSVPKKSLIFTHMAADELSTNSVDNLFATGLSKF
jgi:hypothetical protein